jgi:cytochrome b561
MRLGNTEARWGAVQKLFHWTVGPLVIAQIVIGLYRMGVDADELRDTLMAWHINIGVTILWLMVLRLLWRAAQPVPRLPATLGEGEKRLALANHYGFYVLLIAQPVLGLLVANSGGYSAPIYGLVELPQVIGEDDALKEALEPVHLGVAIAIAVMIALHIGAALRHEFVLRDDTLRRMLPFGRVRGATPVRHEHRGAGRRVSGAGRAS